MRKERETDGHRLWALVTATVRPLRPPRAASPPPPAPAATEKRRGGARISAHPSAAPARAKVPRPAEAIEPGRRQRLDRGTLALDGRIDLHGLTQDRARAALTAYVAAAHAEGRRAILVITGKGALGGGVLRRRVPEWLAEPPLRPLVAGLSQAHRRHGGEGALYVALKRRGPRRE